MAGGRKDRERGRVSVPGDEQSRLMQLLREGYRIVGLDVKASGVVLHLEPCAPVVGLGLPAGPALAVRIERLEPPLTDEVRRGIEAIHRQVFGEAPGDTYPWLEARPGATCFVAWHEGEVVGFKFGAEVNPRQHHSHEGGVGVAWQRRGVARALMEAQHDWARSWGATAVTTNTMNDFLPMLLLNLSVGFEVVGVEARGGRTKLRLRKPLETLPEG